MPSIHLHTVLDAPPDAAFAVLTDWRANPHWERELHRYALLTPEPLGVGSRLHWVRQIGILRISGHLEITECVAPRRLVSEIADGPIPFRTVVQLEPAGSGTRTDLRAELTMSPRGPLRAATPLLAWNLRRQAAGNLQAFKELVETRARTH
jgi:Polyketide cyclase / dehydrase and lipid transport